MRRVLLLSIFVVCLTASAKAQSPTPAVKSPAAQPAATAPASPAAAQAARASFAKLPLSFEENVGQTDGRVKYTSSGAGYNLFLTADEAVFALRSGSPSSNCTRRVQKHLPVCADPQNNKHDESVLWLKMLGANSSAQVSGTDPLPGKINYYIGNDPAKWRTGVRQYGRVSYRGIYPGVDLTYYGNRQQLESDFVVAPGANPRSIEFEIQGARESRLDAQGNLVMATAAGNVRLLHPVVYQVEKGARRDIPGRYVLLAENRIGFEIGKYDARETLVIDPVFIYSTYLGGSGLFSGGDSGLAIAIDSTGAAYVTGLGESTTFPGSATAGPVAQTSPFAFVTKFNATGTALLYSTELRGTFGFSDSGNGIGVDSNKNAYVTGITSDSDFPLLNPFQATIGDVFSAEGEFFATIQSGFVAGLDTNGALIYSTYFGGRNESDQTSLNGLAVDATGNAYVVGETDSQNFPTVNPLQATLGSSFQTDNVVVAKFNPQGQPIYSTYLGGAGPDVGNAIAIDASGNAYITGQTSSSSFTTPFPVQSVPAPFQAANNGGDDVFVSKLAFNSTSLSLAGSTLLGGSSTDEAFGIAVDGATPPNVYITGETLSSASSGTAFPTKNSLFAFAGGNDAFVAEFTGDLTQLVYSTFLGGGTTSASNIGYAIALDGANPPNVFVTGSTSSGTFPVLAPLQANLATVGGTSNAFVAEIGGVTGTTTAPKLAYSTYLGGSQTDQGRGIAVDTAGDVYIVGSTSSPNFPVMSGGLAGTTPFQGQLGTSQGNAFVAKIGPGAAPSGLNFFPPSVDFHDVGVGATSATQSITVNNNSAGTITITSFTLTGTNPGDFAVVTTGSTCIGAAVTANTSCNVNVNFSPTLQDARSATLGINSSPASASTMNLAGFGSVPELSFSPTTINFGNVPLNVTTPSGVSLVNRGGGPLHVGNVEITGTDAGAYRLPSPASCALIQPNGGQCSIEVDFTALAAQSYNNATLVINDDAAGSPQSIPITGAGTAQVNLSPQSAEFFGWLVGTTSNDSGFVLQNGSGGNITLTSIAVTGNSGDFPGDPNNTTCVANLVLLPGVSCDYAIRFAPTAGSGIDGRQATFTFNYTGTKLSGSKAGTAMGAGETGVTLYTPTYTAPGVSVGATGQQVDFDQVFNGTTSTVTVTSIVLGGANPQDFKVALDNSCSTNGVIPVSSVCFLDGAFSPSAVGTRSVTATINYTINSSTPTSGSLVLTATGTGNAGPVTFPGAFDFGSQIVSILAPTERVFLQNIGKTPITISNVSALAGTNAADFAILPTSTCKTTPAVPNGGNCYFDLTFTPGATGSRTASFTVTDNGTGSPRTLNLSGTGEAAAQTISISPNNLDFGSVVLLTESGLNPQPTVSAKFTLINAGTLPATITVAPVLSNGTVTQAPFAIATGTNTTTCVLNQVVLPQGGTCNVVVQFTPTNTTAQTNSVTLTYKVGTTSTPVTVPVTAIGVNQAVVSFGTGLTFNQTASGGTTASQPITLTNSGTGPATIMSLNLMGSNSSNFAIVPPPATTCVIGTTGFTLPSTTGSNTCVVAVTFTAPSKLGTYNGSVVVTANLGNNVTTSASGSLTGNVVAGGLSSSPASIAFGSVAIGTSITFNSVNNSNPNQSNFVVLTNNTTSAATITSIAPLNAGDFTITPSSSTCPVSPAKLPNSQFSNTCTFNVTFAPTVSAAEPANDIVVTYNNGGASSQLMIPLTGTGSSALVASPNPLNVSAAVGGFGGSPTITIGNGSASTVNIVSVGSITGAGAANFTKNFELCTGASLPATGTPGNTCQIFLSYSPTAPGTNVAAQILVTYTVGANPTQQTLTLNLSSTATAPAVSISPSQTPPTPLIFPGQVINTQSLPLAVVVTNTGTASLFISGMQITGANLNDFALAPQGFNLGTQFPTINSCNFGTLTPGQSCTIPITFTPAPPPLTGGATRMATLTITDNAFPSTTQTVLLEGNAIGGSVAASPSSITFPDTNVGLSMTQSVSLINASSSAVTFTNVTFVTNTSYSIDATQTLNACSASKPLSAFTGSCTVYIKFTPALGANPDTATIHTSNGSPTVTLSGTGKSSSVSVSPTSLTFSGLQLVGTQSSPLPVTLTNGTASTITISSTPITGDYLLGTNSCSGTVTAGGNCIVNVIFKPTATGTRTGTLTINDSGSPSFFSVSLSGTGTAPSTITSTSGATQSVVVNSAFATLQATVKDANSNVLPGVSVTFTVTAAGSGASGTFTGSVTSTQVTTDSNGIATAPTFTANNIPGGPYTVAATAGAVGPATFSLTNTQGTPTSITANTGTTPQSVAINAAFSTALSVTVKDASSQPLDGVVVTFTSPASGASGTFTGGTSGGTVVTATTNTSGVATAPTFTANATAGGPYNVTAKAGAVGPANFSLTNLTGTPASVTATAGTPQSAVFSTAFALNLTATVKDGGGNLLSGVTVTFTSPSTGASGTFTGGTSGGTVITASTNASGVATATTFTANATVGAYTVNASVSGVATKAAYSLNNTAGPAANIAATAGTPQSAAVTAAFTTNLAATVTDSGGNPISGATVTFTAPSSGASGTFAGGTSGGTVVTAATNASGVATATVFTANSTIGGYTVTAAVGGVVAKASFSLTNAAGPPASIAATAGTPQSATISAAFATSLQATVTDGGGNPVNNATVTFTSPSTGASGTFAGGTSGGTVVTATTNASGVATAAVFTANTTAGAYTVTAAVGGVVTKASFSLTNNAGAPATITATAGTPQSATISAAFTTNLSATVKDGSGNLVNNATVTFTSPSSGASGTFAGGTSGGTVVTATTNASGVATAAVFTANTVAGAYTVTASVTGVVTKASFALTNNAGSPASVTATVGTPQSATISSAFATNLAVTVKDGSGNLVNGATVTFNAPLTGASGIFTGGTNGGLTATVTTNASGVATAPVFTANKTAGPYTINATVVGVVTPAAFLLTNNAGAAATITATGGATQSVAINIAFASLQATVADSGGNGASGVSVTFTITAAVGGASGTFTGGVTSATVTTAANGVATAPILTANSTSGGPFTVAAKAGAIGPANFSLTNLSAPPASIAATTGSGQSATISTVFAVNLQATVLDSGSHPISGVTVTFTAPSSGASGKFTGGTNGGLTATAVTNSSGVATAPVFTANTTAGGPYNVQATAGSVSANFSLTNLTGPPATITATGGATQSVIISTAFATLQATVKDSGGNPVNNVTVTFTAPASGASGTFAGGTSGGTVVTATTNASGVATASTFTANTTAGAYTVNASVSGVSAKASYSLTNLPGAASKLLISGGGSQSVAVNTAFSSLAVTVTDASGNGVSGVSVTFNAPASGPSGTFTGGTNGGLTAVVVTGASGVAAAPAFTSNNTVGGPYLVAASALSLTTVDFSLTNLAGTPASITATSGSNQSVAISALFNSLVATVKDNKSNPLSGVVVTFTAPASGASGTFAGGTNGGTTVTATTDASGNATAPAFTANGTAGGPYTVNATVSGVVAPAPFSLTNLAGAPSSVTATAGASQSIAITKAFTTNLAVTVKDNGGNVLSGVVVMFNAPSTGASGTFTGGTNGGLTVTATTNANGVATAAVFTANSTVGTYTVNATVGVLTPAPFSLTNQAGPAATVTATAGTPQTVTISSAFPTALSATVKDSGGNPVSGATVTFTAPSTGASGTFAGGTSGGTIVTATTNASGVATAAAFTANGTAGAYTVNATVTGVTAPAAFSLTNNAGSPATITATAGTPQSAPVTTAFATNLQVTVKDTGGNLVSGASVTFTAPASGASGTFAAPGIGVTATVTTNASGVATAPVFTANATGGAYSVKATVGTVSPNAVFALTNTVAPDVTIAKSHTGIFTVSSNGIYTMKVTNNGTGPTTGTVTVTDTLPTGLTFVSGTATGGWSCSATGQTVTCTNATAGLLAAKGGNSTVTLTVSVGPNAISSPTNFSVTNSAMVSDPGDSGTNDKSSTDAATNIANAVPTVSSFSPALGLIAGAATDQQITLTGTGFNASTQVTGFGTTLTGTASADGKTLTVTIPHAELATAGNVTITVTNPATNGGGGSATNQTFPLVGLQSIAPQSGTPNPVPIVAGTPYMLQMNLNLTPSGATLPADVTITCSFPMALAGATCTPTPGTIAHGATAANATSMIAITAIPTTGGTTGSSVSGPGIGGRGPWLNYLSWMVLAVLLSILAMARKFQERVPQFRRAPAYLALVLLAVGAGVLVGCTTAAKTTPTPTGPSTMTVTATTADGASVSTTVNITISN